MVVVVHGLHSLPAVLAERNHGALRVEVFVPEVVVLKTLVILLAVFAVVLRVVGRLL